MKKRLAKTEQAFFCLQHAECRLYLCGKEYGSLAKFADGVKHELQMRDRLILELANAAGYIRFNDPPKSGWKKMAKKKK